MCYEYGTLYIRRRDMQKEKNEKARECVGRQKNLGVEKKKIK